MNLDGAESWSTWPAQLCSSLHGGCRSEAEPSSASVSQMWGPASYEVPLSDKRGINGKYRNLYYGHQSCIDYKFNLVAHRKGPPSLRGTFGTFLPSSLRGFTPINDLYTHCKLDGSSHATLATNRHGYIASAPALGIWEGGGCFDNAFVLDLLEARASIVLFGNENIHLVDTMANFTIRETQGCCDGVTEKHADGQVGMEISSFIFITFGHRDSQHKTYREICTRGPRRRYRRQRKTSRRESQFNSLRPLVVTLWLRRGPAKAGPINGCQLRSSQPCLSATQLSLHHPIQTWMNSTTSVSATTKSWLL